MDKLWKEGSSPYSSHHWFLTLIPNLHILQMQKQCWRKRQGRYKSKENVPQSRKKSFPNTSPTSYDIATGENSYANSVMQAPFSSEKCVEIDWVSSWWYCSQALWKLIGKRCEKSWHCTCSYTDFHCAPDTHHTQLLLQNNGMPRSLWWLSSIVC